jgi:hypothetical protein
MTVAAVLFAIAALGGITLASIRLGGRELPPMPLALGHGALAASGLVALLITVLQNRVSNLALASLGLFVLAALGGFTLFSFHLRRRALPVPLVLGHGLIAVVAFALLLVVLLGRG